MIPANQVYGQEAVHTPPERKGAGRNTVIGEAKARVRTVDLAVHLCGADGLRWVGDRAVARCPLPDHEDRTPSFTVYLSGNSWYCFGACRRGGDAVDLAAAAWGYGEGEMAMAAAALLHEFGHPIPERPHSWFARQSRQRPVRDEVEAIRFRHLRRRLFRLYVPMIERIEDTDERREEAEMIWEETKYLARLMRRHVYEGAQR